MCGITGWVSYDRGLESERGTVDAMTETMSCRGPDARGTWINRHAALGHRRLAVIDLPGGAQPMSIDLGNGESVAMVYSGEAYNYRELRDELRRRGHRFSTDSDTEVVLRGYLEWGEALAERLNGMYAFAIWDTRAEKLVMIRDRLGIKPFYYYPTSDGVLFGSEPKAILANPDAEAVVDSDGLHEMLLMVKTPRQAIWAGMREVEPGTVITVDRSGIREHIYWKLETRQHPDDQDASVAHVRELLDDIVRRQLVADVPRCVLLSGGLDSSALTALSAGQLAEQGEKVRSFAVDFVGQTENFTPDEMRDTPDAPFVRDVANHVDSEHADILLDHTALADPQLRETVIRARDLPVGLGDMDASLYLLFKAIREKSTVALSGESADEVFGGYRWIHDPEAQRADTFPWLAGRSAAMARAFGGESLLSVDAQRKLDLQGYTRDRYAEAIAEIDRLPGESDQEWRMRKICYLHLTRFVRQLLDRKDRISMAVGLEVRVPFCDHRLVEYVFNAPWSLKSFDGREKSLLRHATKDVLPQSVVDRVKSPYPSTQDPHYPRALAGQARQLLADDHPVFDVLNRNMVAESVRDDDRVLDTVVRTGLERVLNLATWMDIYRPKIQLS